MYRILWAFALVLAAGCSNKLNGDGLDTGRRGPPEDTDVVDTDVEDTGPVDTGTPELDEDGDGFKPSQGDCDDADATVYPGAPELCDGKDNDCDGLSDADLDDDGDGIADCDDNCPIYVDDDVVGGTGTYADPFQWIQDAIDAAASYSCDTIRVRPGTYLETIDYLGQDLDVASTDGPSRTWIVGDGTSSVVTFENGETDKAILEGFTVTSGGGEFGGGVYAYGADPVITGNVITGNVMNAGMSEGGGIFLKESSAYVYANEISGNDACWGGPESGCDGGAIFVRNGQPVIEANVMEANTAGDGGALWFAHSDALVIDNWIVGNDAYDTDPVKAGQGGGVDVQIGTTSFYMAGNVIVDNTASMYGGGVAIYEYGSADGNPSVLNNTIAYNTVTDADYGAGLLAYSTTQGVVTNNVIYGNHGSGVWLNGTTTFTYNDVYGNTTDYAGNQGTLTGTSGNVSADPKVKAASDDGDWTNDDWAPTSKSPLKDAGDPSVSDKDGSRSDIGATGGAYGL